MTVIFQLLMRRLASGAQRAMNWLAGFYDSYLSGAQANVLVRLGIRQSDADRRPIGFRPGQETPAHSPDWANLPVERRAEASPVDHLAHWARLMRCLGFQATYVLVDGIDEFLESADDLVVGYLVVRSLLACLRLMDETPYLALKCFLPSDIKSQVEADKAIRRDRGLVLETIVWTEEELIRILRRRLAALRADDAWQGDRIEAGFDALCVPELRGEIERKLAQAAHGNPRRLLELCGRMVTAHCAREIEGQDDPYQLNQQDFEIALEQDGPGRITTETIPSPDKLDDLRRLIAAGENERVEFKASMRWDPKTQAANRSLYYVLAKAIAGMMNAAGGLVLIGVADDGTILGIANDLKTLAKPTLDGFRLALADVVKSYLGVDFMSLIRVNFVAVDEKWVCLVSVQPSPQPVFLTVGDAHEFWVRLWNSTRNLDVMSATRYIQSRWQRAT